MVRIENIKIEGDIISCNYFPDNKELKGFVKYDRKKHKIIEWNPTQENEWEAYVSHSLSTIIKAIENNNIEPIMYSYWY